MRNISTSFLYRERSRECCRFETVCSLSKLGQGRTSNVLAVEVLVVC